MKQLTNIELYYSSSSFFDDNKITITGEEAKHIVKVMRHSPGDAIFITNGKGSIFKSIINNIDDLSIDAEISEEFKYDNKFRNLIFCIPKLKNPDRFEFALEKCTELGITNFIIFDSGRTIKKSNKPDRWEKILLAAMKQSLRCFLPNLEVNSSIEELAKLEGRKILFSQDANERFHFADSDSREKYYFIFGPEGDFTELEKSLFSDAEFYNLGDHRLRSETAIIKCASLI